MGLVLKISVVGLDRRLEFVCGIDRLIAGSSKPDAETACTAKEVDDGWASLP